MKNVGAFHLGVGGTDFLLESRLQPVFRQVGDRLKAELAPAKTLRLPLAEEDRLLADPISGCYAKHH